jgi:hypothetical protein
VPLWKGGAIAVAFCPTEGRFGVRQLAIDRMLREWPLNPKMQQFMGTVPDIIEVVLKALTDRIALAAAGVCIISLAIAYIFPNVAMGQWAKDHIVWICLALLFSLCYLPTRHIIEASDRYIVSRGKERKIKMQLESLGTDDKFLLYNPIKIRNTTFKTGSLHYHIAKSLEKRGIVSEVADSSFAIEAAAFSYLVAHPELVGINKGS